MHNNHYQCNKKIMLYKNKYTLIQQVLSNSIYRSGLCIHINNQNKSRFSKLADNQTNIVLIQINNNYYL